jgi:hypothetical protein
MLEIVNFFLSESLDFRISLLLAAFKTCQRDATLLTMPEDRWTPDDRPDVQVFIGRAARIFDISVADSNEPIVGDIDGESGRRLLRVVARLVLSPSHTVVESAIKVLLRGFSMRAELLRTVHDVQLLVRDDLVKVLPAISIIILFIYFTRIHKPGIHAYTF